jgi:hypothetical protein
MRVHEAVVAIRRSKSPDPSRGPWLVKLPHLIFTRGRGKEADQTEAPEDWPNRFHQGNTSATRSLNG